MHRPLQKSKNLLANFFHGDLLFANLTRLCGGLLILLLLGMSISLWGYSWPSIKAFGWHFFISTEWDPVSDQFGALPVIMGTLISSFIAMLIAVPLSLGIAVLIIEVLPKSIGDIIARLVELMAGIPSIVYGMWGLFMLAPFLATHIQPWLITHSASIPVLNFIFGGLPIGIGMFTAGVILAIMIIPLISSMMRDVLSTVPELMKEAAYGMGATRYEVVRYILLPYTRAGLFGSVILGLGRALGETMAVTFVIGNSHQLLQGLFMPSTTISATIANEFTEALGTLYPSSLMELGLILFLITIVVLSISRYFLNSMKTRGGSQ
ncbi:MAG: phosphate ABC transporter permease subunit PstC [Gammaproteobacteria bacterium]|nr:phosphate ABC transporter permease subunit PstC [Gammaproteobacteria bacterium]